jgi:hypothetical protein
LQAVHFRNYLDTARVIVRYRHDRTGGLSGVDPRCVADTSAGTGDPGHDARPRNGLDAASAAISDGDDYAGTSAVLPDRIAHAGGGAGDAPKGICPRHSLDRDGLRTNLAASRCQRRRHKQEVREKCSEPDVQSSAFPPPKVVPHVGSLRALRS